MATARSARPPGPLLIIGLDGVPPGFLFDRFLEQMPTVRRLIRKGVRATLRSTDPPISVPAWPVMFTGVDPGTLGLYGFRHRRPGSYTQMYIPTSRDLPVPTLWQILSDHGLRVGVIGMPPGYPPPPVNGIYISDFLTPAGSPVTTHPASLGSELEREFGPYQFDVTFRTHDRDDLPGQLRAMTRHRFQVAEALLARDRWDVFAVHEIGTDRLHHAFWKQLDPTHPEYVAGSPMERFGEEYYADLDAGIGRLIAAAGPDAEVLIVSDHGSMSMRGCFCVNQWLEGAGYLVLHRPAPAPGTPLEGVDVDWARTTAWAAGGYYARIFFNLVGRERDGVVPLGDVPALRDQLAADLARLVDPEGKPVPFQLLDPQSIYAARRGAAPDLLLYLDDLRLRAAGTMGHPDLFLAENDTGPDDAVHSFDGVFLLAGPGTDGPRELPPLAIRDVTPTILERLGLPVPEHVQGRPISGLDEPFAAAKVPTSPGR